MYLFSCIVLYCIVLYCIVFLQDLKLKAMFADLKPEIENVERNLLVCQN